MGQTSQGRAAAPAPKNLSATPVERNPASARADAYAEAGDAINAEIAAAAAIERRNRAMDLERRLARQTFYDAAPAGHKPRNTQDLNVQLSYPARSWRFDFSEVAPPIVADIPPRERAALG